MKLGRVRLSAADQRRCSLHDRLDALGIVPTERFWQTMLPMAIVALDGTILAVNQALLDYTGHAPDVVLGHVLADIPEAPELLGALASGTHDSAQFDVPLERADGATLQATASWTTIRTGNGDPWYLTAVLVDITERARTREEVERASRRWESLVANAFDVTCMADADGSVLWASGALPGQLGWTREEVRGRHLVSLVHPDDVPVFAASWERMLREGQAVNEARVAHADGTWRWMRGALTDLLGDPDVQAVVVNVVDITERRRVEEELTRSEQLHRARFEQSAVPQSLIDAQGRLLAVNAALCALLGEAERDLVGRSAWSTAAVEDAEAERSLRDVLSGRVASARYERVLQTSDAGEVTVLVDVTGLSDAQGAPMGAAATLLDLTPVRLGEQRLRRQEEFFLALSQRASDAAVVSDAAGQIVYASPAVEQVFGYEPAEVVGRHVCDFLHADDVDRARQEYAGLVSDAVTRALVVRVRGGDGRWVWAEALASNLLGTALGGIVSNLRDVTDRVEAERALRASEERYRVMAETAQEGIWAVTRDGETLYANAKLAEILGVTLREVYELPVVEMLAPEDAAGLVRRLHERAMRGPEQYELAYRHPDGSLRVLAINASPLPGPDSTVAGSLKMVSDVTDARRGERELRRAALRDTLTGLPNRALLVDRLQHAAQRTEDVGYHGTAVLFVDLDQFKLVNDARGHEVGDEVLVAAARRLEECVRPHDTVARFGGDEFVVVCEDIGELEAGELAQALLAALAEPLQIGGQPVHVAASIGVAVSPPAAHEDLLRYADGAMYRAKAAGRGRFRVFDQRLADEADAVFSLAADLRLALAAGELELHHQPIVEVRTGRLVAVEALARWTHPAHGPISPARFVSVAEQTGLAGQLDRWVLEHALAEVAQLRREGALPEDVSVSVNISARNVTDLGLEQVALSAADRAGLPPSAVVLELTESAIMDDAEQAASLLRRLRAHGFGIAVDDFGTGYSSLAYLKRLPVTSIKIDRTFVEDIADDRDALAIVASIVDLAHAVGVTATAEGVETAEQASMLAGLGCDHAQGWVWSRAVPAAELRHQRPAALECFGANERPSGAARAGRGTQAGSEHGLERLLELHAQGASLATIAAGLNSEGFRTPQGLRWHPASVARVVSERAYPQLRSD